MSKIDSTREVRRWFSIRRSDLAAQSVTASLKTSDEKGSSKAVVTLQAPNYLANITVWDNGLLEFVALERMTKAQAHVHEKEFATEQGLQVLLNLCSRIFIMLRDDAFNPALTPKNRRPLQSSHP